MEFLIKRQTIMNRIDTILYGENKHALLHGIGGIGKTTIANQYVNELVLRKKNKVVIDIMV